MDSSNILTGAYKSLFKRYKKGAKTRNLSFNLSELDFLNLITSNCSFCGTTPFQTHGKIKYMGIDRVSNDVGYEKANCSPCCKHCNYAKGTMKFWEFDEWLERIAEYYPRKMKAYQTETVHLFNKKSKLQIAMEKMRSFHG